MHAFNIRTLLSEEAEYTWNEKKAGEYLALAAERELRWKDKIPTIKAYERSNGDIGIRNELWALIEGDERGDGECQMLRQFSGLFHITQH